MKNESTDHTKYTYTPSPGDLVIACHRRRVSSTTPVLGLPRGSYTWDVEVPPNTPMLAIELAREGATFLVLHNDELIEILIGDLLPASGKHQ